MSSFTLSTAVAFVKVELCDFDFLRANATAFLNVDGTACSFTYKDAEGDSVAIKNENDLNEAILYMKDEGLSTLLITVSLPVTPSPAPAVPAPASTLAAAPTPVLEESKAPAVMHTRRVCDGCMMYPIAGTRYRSKKNKLMDFCSSCAADSKFHMYAPFDAFEKELPTHDSVTCDGCEMSPLEGTRYKSTVVDDFDLCEDCEASGKWAATHEPFLKITHPKKMTVPENVHERVICDGCDVEPIVGARFKSALVKNFDLCESCERTGKWNLSHGPFLKIYTRHQAPVALYVATNQEENVQSEEEFAAHCGHRGHHRGHHHGHHHGPHHHGHSAPWKKCDPEGWKQKRDFWKQHCSEQKVQWKQQCQEQKAQWKAQKKAWKQAKHCPGVPPTTDDQATVAAAMDEMREKIKAQLTPETVAEIMEAFLPAEMCEKMKAFSDEWMSALHETGQFKAKFVADVTIPDGTVCYPGETLVKQWRLVNNGDVAWPAGATVEMVGGVSMANDAVVSVPTVAPGAECVVEVAMLAPTTAGRHVSFFRVSAPDGTRFGHRFWIDVVVDAEMAQAVDANFADNADVVIPMATLVVEDKVVDKLEDFVEEPKAEVAEESKDVTKVDDVEEVAKVEEPKEDEAKEIEIETTQETEAPKEEDYVAVSSDGVEEALEAEADKLMEAQDEFATEVSMLAAMGFTDEARLRGLLAQFEGNLEKVVEQLLQ
ncbi:Aste57867_14459 [Aphanomyces stellatus]|uniref:Aste57867_14459 protein n=1 Tax=Aphanomyces stellatus TaxID=120398 RepID=A0A485L0P0_9STRA|nr:hypothetical protein As57867_014405 [Aphanomyces stellatus]VFT91281.1 Aste57867_14459 [Aphanomyces stellatus]